MRLVLFDIDGTLLSTGGVGQASTRVAMLRVFGTSGRLERFYPGGRTIEAIYLDTLVDAGVSDWMIAAGRALFYEEYLKEFEHRIQHGKYPVRPCPGGLELVKALIPREGVLLGLATGNHHRTAELKLTAAGYDFDCFPVGAFGHETADRSILVGEAQERASQLADVELRGRDIVMIGDTTRDVGSAQRAGARSIAVASGTDDIEILREVGPDYLYPDLSDTRAVLDAILS
jgi:phosphoglycolate phosphatase-like HAD superfamily hydrolase